MPQLPHHSGGETLRHVCNAAHPNPPGSRWDYLQLPGVVTCVPAASWDYLPSKLYAFKSSSQGLFLAEGDREVRQRAQGMLGVRLIQI